MSDRPNDIDIDEGALSPDAGLDLSTDVAEERITLDEMVSRIVTGMQLFAVAVKNGGLYPANSAIRQEAMTRSHEWFRTFLEQQESLRLFVDPDSLLFQGQPVHRDKPGEPSLIFPMFRDGLQWLEFNDGLTRPELGTLVELLNRYRILKDDDEDDLVTSMWGADFQYIKYKTANDFWDIDPVTEIAALTAGPGLAPTMGMALSEGGGGPGGTDQDGVSALMELASGVGRRQLPNLPGQEDLSTSSGSFSDGSDESGEISFHRGQSLADDDRRALLEMSSRDRRGDSLMVGLSPVLDLLWRLKTVAQAKPILYFLGESIRHALAMGRFQDVESLLARLELIADKAHPRLAGLKNETLALISSQEVLSGLAMHRTPDGPGAASESMAHLDSFLARIPANAVKILTTTASETHDPATASAFMRALAARSPAVTPELGALINVALRPTLLLELIELLRPSLEAGYGLELMTTLSRHVAPQVREAASLALLAATPQAIGTLSHLLAEPDPSLNRRIYACLGTGRDAKVEKAILSFLRSSRQVGVSRDETGLINAYRALGLAASTGAAGEFCLEVASRRSPKALLGLEGEQERAHRSGAALALILMGRQDTVAGLGRSLFKDVRRAAQEAEDEAARVRRSTARPAGR